MQGITTLPACQTPAGYEPPLARDVDIWPAPIDGLYPLADGVEGYAVMDGHQIDIRVINAIKEGSGAVGRFLDSLSPRCVFKCVISRRLAGMLARRQWRCTFDYDPDCDDLIDVWSHPRSAK
jgi:hypothetical protein